MFITLSNTLSKWYLDKVYIQEGGAGVAQSV
jgi:hypothetical protein